MFKRVIFFLRYIVYVILSDTDHYPLNKKYRRDLSFGIFFEKEKITT